ncbi:3-hydroxyacyl-CoA dehydrogenase NAD-binding domain-containing protein [Nocardia zapadnayensis]|uniref:3-hydroxyacyl-CoA dehydrogenase family protein n=1 Tax=Nocardia rhamnosiphila TaxID=426716 RepID=UPI002247148E|nr:3-hydroxyacyl-CoA dehydrogenase NAD-binding domain-containing protein [Nocardia zapadnayensis]MCX0272722.1 3-hydroxyacyl-CoA dehydrogenase NAD-binding domain-containing protein [Nocardia zapadnayensis]
MSESSTDLATIGLLGLGTTGAGIAQLLAASGRKVVAVETDRARLDAGLAAVAAFLDGGVSRGTVTEADKHAVLDRVTGTTSVTELRGVDAVLECVTENAEVKTTLLSEVAATVGDRIPLLTTTSTLSVTDLAAGLPEPGRVAGLHFFDPAPIMHTVEIVRALQTEEDLIDRLVALVDTLDVEVAVVVDDRPGFLINALLLPYLNDVVAEYDEGLATAEDIDTALELGLGYRTGPLKLLDSIGLDVHLHATEAAYMATGDPRYAPPPLLRRMVAAGWLGSETGHGFRTAPHREDNT